MTLTAEMVMLTALAAGPVVSPASWHDLVVPGGIAPLAQAAGLPPRTEPWRLVPQIARRVHAPYGEGRGNPHALDRIAAHLDAVAGPGEAVPGGGVAPRPAEAIPLPLSPETWRAALALRPLDDGGLLRALVTDRAAALLYSGLVWLDAPTLASVSDARTLATLAARHALVFHLVAPAFRVLAGRVAAPGGEAAASAWQAVVGAPLTDPPRFLLALLGRDDGCLAILYAALDGLDPARQAWALALDGRPGSAWSGCAAGAGSRPGSPRGGGAHEVRSSGRPTTSPQPSRP